MPVRIEGIKSFCALYSAGLRKGDLIVSVNGVPVEDFIDAFYLISQSDLAFIEYERNGVRNVVRVDNADTRGVKFESIKPRACKLKCIFCFMDQMPLGLRKTLYFKDDDYRLSFLFGNYITLTNLTEKDLIRIKSYNLSPLYVSVHSTIGSVRAFMMGSERASHIMEDLKTLSKYCSYIHTQVVVCPGINDGYVLEKTVMDLLYLYPFVRSVAVVPVGLTKYRNNLFPLKPVDTKKAREILRIVLSVGEKAKREFGTRFVFPADELFIKAGFPFPKEDFYEGFPQLEDGVGSVTYFTSFIKPIKKRLRVSIVTGEAFYPFLLSSLIMAGIEDFEVVSVKNRFFGPYVDVAGLLTGRDVVKALRDTSYDEVWLPSVMFNDDGLTIDGMDVEDLENLTRKRIRVVPHLAEEFWEMLQ